MLLHFARQICIIITTPIILAGANKRTPQPPTTKNLAASSASDRTKRWCARCLSYGLLLGPAAVGAPLGKLTGHPLGPLLGAFLAVAVVRILSLRAGEVPFPRILGVVVQSLAGVLLGVCVTPDIGRLLLTRLLPFGLSVVYIVGAGLFISHLLQKWYGWSKELSWMSAAPGRTSDMLAISQDLAMSGRDRLALVTTHTVRQIAFTLLLSLVTALF